MHYCLDGRVNPNMMCHLLPDAFYSHLERSVYAESFSTELLSGDLSRMPSKNADWSSCPVAARGRISGACLKVDDDDDRHHHPHLLYTMYMKLFCFHY